MTSRTSRSKWMHRASMALRSDVTAAHFGVTAVLIAQLSEVGERCGEITDLRAGESLEEFVQLGLVLQLAREHGQLSADLGKNLFVVSSGQPLSSGVGVAREVVDDRGECFVFVHGLTLSSNQDLIKEKSHVRPNKSLHTRAHVQQHARAVTSHNVAGIERAVISSQNDPQTRTRRI